MALDVGIAVVDLTPDTPIRLNGFASGDRYDEVPAVAGQLFAKALAIGAGADAAVLITVDNCAIPEQVSRDVANRLFAGEGIARERLAICYSHSHMSPCLTDAIPAIFRWPQWPNPTPEQIDHVDAYTALVTDRLVTVAVDALADRAPAVVDWSRGTVGFAANRRPRTDVYGRNGFPVDHDLPILRVTSGANHSVRAVLVSYACHCVNSNAQVISGDWAGAAQREIETRLPGAMALVTIGCAADADPATCGENQIQVQGAQVATEVMRLMDTGSWSPIDSVPDCVLADVPLPRTNGEMVTYPVQAWRFGSDLTMVFLAGEAVVDYADALKTDYDGAPLWINAYANTCRPGYIPTRWVMREALNPPAGQSFWYTYEALIANTDVYKLTGTRYPDDLETRILDTVRAQVSGMPRTWVPVGPAEDVVAMAASSGRLYVSTRGGRLFWRDPAAPVGAGWTDIGEAQTVRALGASAGTLFCVTQANSLQVRGDDLQPQPWQAIGEGPPGGLVTAVAAIDGMLFAATQRDELWARPALPIAADWTRVGHAEHCIALTGTDTDLICATYEGALFRRPALLVDTPWTHTGLARDVVALAVIENRLYRVTRLDQLLVRDVP